LGGRLAQGCGDVVPAVVGFADLGDDAAEVLVELEAQRSERLGLADDVTAVLFTAVFV
jgi:hypothetical protein